MDEPNWVLSPSYKIEILRIPDARDFSSRVSSSATIPSLVQAQSVVAECITSAQAIKAFGPTPLGSWKPRPYTKRQEEKIMEAIIAANASDAEYRPYDSAYEDEDEDETEGMTMEISIDYSFAADTLTAPRFISRNSVFTLDRNKVGDSSAQELEDEQSIETPFLFSYPALQRVHDSPRSNANTNSPTTAASSTHSPIAEHSAVGEDANIVLRSATRPKRVIDRIPHSFMTGLPAREWATEGVGRGAMRGGGGVFHGAPCVLSDSFFMYRLTMEGDADVAEGVPICAILRFD